MEPILRSALLALSRSRTACRAARRYGMKLGASRFVAGESIEKAMAAVRALNADGISATLDHLGESVTTEEEAREAAACCLQTLEAIRETGVDSHLSVKLTQLGLDLSPGLCEENMRRIVGLARSHRNFVRIDMEDYAHNEATLDLFEKLHREFGSSVGLVLQSYLYKSEKDLVRLGRYGPNVRIVKGAYKESPRVAFPRKADVDRSYIRMVESHMRRGHYTAVATHDDAIIRHVKRFARSNGIPRDRFEFQMLFGIRTQEQLALAKQGYKVRVYVPFGVDWYGYFMRRLAERPANVAFVLKSLFK
ncbi:proline dehydrogenase [Paenibacillus sp. J31TS4]|uniref:proline dehydrogenase family protein n=1 Tax=Paenibacillus sp. J31TS4 TaxID=2807195 RepID=UPI001B1DCB9D|nr:proline dehydrogenase family protein [Paenibacillus sp. J31TS4]GIP37718.1 proline dehydrogenase [Paenibacillus sp. J31TS4]